MRDLKERINPSELARYRRRDMVPQGVESGNLIGYEHGDTNIRAVVTSMVIIFGSVIVIMLLAAATFNYFGARERRLKDAMYSPMLAMPVVPPSPRMLPSPYLGSNMLPWDAMTVERAAAEDKINVEGSAEKIKGAIPIADAMTQLAQKNGDAQGKGLPAYSTLTPRSPLYPPNVNFENQESRLNVEGSGGRVLSDPKLDNVKPGVPQSFPSQTSAQGGKGANTVNTALTKNKPRNSILGSKFHIDAY